MSSTRNPGRVAGFLYLLLLAAPLRLIYIPSIMWRNPLCGVRTLDFALGDWGLCVVADGTVLQGVPARAGQSNVEAVARQVDILPHRGSTREASKPCDYRAARRCEFAGRYSLLNGVRRRSSTHF
jgi:hypothetical protein